MIPRTPEPEVMDSMDEAIAYDQMDHDSVNRIFVDDLLAAWQTTRSATPDAASAEWIDVVDLGCGTSQIPVLLCQSDEQMRVVAADASPAMLDVAIQNIDIAGLRERIRTDLVNARSLSELGQFDVVMSNSLVHHLHEPEALLCQLAELCKPTALLFTRDLARPDSEDEVEQLVAEYAGRETAEAQRLFRESLHASLTVDEVRAMVERFDFDPRSVTMSSDRHWTWTHVTRG